MSYAEIVLATVPAAPPTEKNQRATSCPPPISARVPYLVASRFSASAFCRVPEGVVSMLTPSFDATSRRRCCGERHSLALGQSANNAEEDRREEQSEEGHADHSEEDHRAQCLAHFAARAGGDDQR